MTCEKRRTIEDLCAKYSRLVQKAECTHHRVCELEIEFKKVKERIKQMNLEQVLNHQVGGTHYQGLPFQPVELILKYNLGFCMGNALKYVIRYKDKNGVEDLKKALHYLEIEHANREPNWAEDKKYPDDMEQTYKEDEQKIIASGKFDTLELSIIRMLLWDCFPTAEIKELIQREESK